MLLIVDKEYRNKGIGSKLLKQCEEHIKSCGYDKITVGAGYDYLMPGVPTSRKYTDSINENLSKEVNDKASKFFENQLYTHAWGDCVKKSCQWQVFSTKLILTNELIFAILTKEVLL